MLDDEGVEEEEEMHGEADEDEVHDEEDHEEGGKGGELEDEEHDEDEDDEDEDEDGDGGEDMMVGAEHMQQLVDMGFPANRVSRGVFLF